MWLRYCVVRATVRPGLHGPWTDIGVLLNVRARVRARVGLC